MQFLWRKFLCDLALLVTRVLTLLSLCAMLLCNPSGRSSLPRTLNLFSPTQIQPSSNGRRAHLATLMLSRRTGHRSRVMSCRSHHYVPPTLLSRWRVNGQLSARRISKSMTIGRRKAGLMVHDDFAEGEGDLHTHSVATLSFFIFSSFGSLDPPIDDHAVCVLCLPPISRPFS